MPPAAKLNDMHLCPMQTPAVVPIPHVGGPVLGPGIPTVLFEGQPAIVVGDACICVGPPDFVQNGSSGVTAMGRAVARLGDPTQHGGALMGPGCLTVIVGEIGSANTKSLMGLGAEGERDDASSLSEAKATWIEVQMNDRGGFGVANTKFTLETPEGKVIHGVTDANGLGRVEGIQPGNHKISFPDLPQDGFKKK
jgi:uncharacterized Zn-binding protein involved in type VI secretion